MKRTFATLLIAISLCLVFVSGVFAQSNTLTLKLSRDWGYGGFNNDIQGLFSMHVTGPENLVKVTFYIDSTSIGEDSAAPFTLQFNTDTYPLGVHSMSAVGVTSTGEELHSNVISAEFVPPQDVGKSLLPVLGAVLLVAVLASVGPLLLMRRKRVNLPPGAERNYGVGGGAICPRCKRPFPLPLIAPNIGLGTKLAACPYCGKISAARRQPMEVLRQAEKAELEGQSAASSPQGSEEEKLRKEIDDSKYQGL